MNEYDARIVEAEHFRVDLYQPDQAISKYRAALAIGGPRDRHCQQQIGVCYKIKRQYATAVKWFQQAAIGASEYELGNIYRDWAEAESGRGDYSRAEELLRRSLDLLPFSDYPEEHAVTRGFLARVSQKEGDIQGALRDYAEADQMLAEGSNRHFELYNKLHYANALSQAGCWISSKVNAVQAFWLARQYGAPAHKKRALVLMLGGYRLDNWAQKRFRP